MNITRNGIQHTAAVETGKHGGAVLVIRDRGEAVFGVKAEHVTLAVLAAWGITGATADMLVDYAASQVV